MFACDQSRAEKAKEGQEQAVQLQQANQDSHAQAPTPEKTVLCKVFVED